MLFLFNNVVLDIGEPASTLAQSSMPINPPEAKEMTIAGLRTAVQEAVFSNPKLAAMDYERASAVAALVQVRLGANACVALMRKGGTGPSDVYLRFTTISEVVMKHLAGLQERGWLTFAAVEVAVWSRAA